MPDLSRIASAETIVITDGSTMQAAMGTTTPTGTEVALIVRNIPSGTQTVGGTVTLSSQTVTLSSQTVTLSSQIVTLSSQTVTTNAEGTVTPGSAPSKVLITGSVYNTAAPAPTAGQVLALQCDNTGDLKVNINGTPITTATITAVAVSNSVTTQLAASNIARNKILIYNNGSNFVYVKLGATASSTSYTFVLYPNGFYEMAIPIYSGQIDALANSATTTLTVTEV